MTPSDWPVGISVGTWLLSDVKSQPTMGGPIPYTGGAGLCKKATEHEPGTKPVSCISSVSASPPNGGSYL